MLSGELGQVDPYQQSLRYSCSAATMMAVLKHYDLNYTEAQLIPLIGLTPEGAWPYQIVRASQQLGLRAFELQFNLDMAKQFLARGVPVIAEVASWNLPGKGHFIVVVSINAQGAQVMDPNTPGNWRVLSLGELSQRWAGGDWRGVVIFPPGT